MELIKTTEGLRRLAADTNYPKADRDFFTEAACAVEETIPRLEEGEKALYSVDELESHLRKVIEEAEKEAESASRGAVAEFAEEVLHEYEGIVLEGKSWPEQIEYLVQALRTTVRATSSA